LKLGVSKESGRLGGEKRFTIFLKTREKRGGDAKVVTTESVAIGKNENSRGDP